MEKIDVSVVGNRIVIHATAEGKTNLYRYTSEDVTLTNWSGNNYRSYSLDKFKEQVIPIKTSDNFSPKLGRISCKTDTVNSYCAINTRGTRVFFM